MNTLHGESERQAPQADPPAIKNFLARNTVLNVLGQGLPLLVGVVAIPIAVKGLGIDRFGILSLAWIVVSYFSLFDLGLGRATTKFAAELLATGRTQDIPGMAWTSLVAHFALGIAGGLVLAGVTPFLIHRILKISPGLEGEASLSFLLLSLCVPFVVASASVRGLLEALHRFDLTNFVRVPSTSLLLAIPALSLPLHIGLPAIVALLVLVRLGTFLALLLFSLRAIPELRRAFLLQKRWVPHLAGYGGWITVCNLFGSAVMYLDRFMLGSLFSLGAVTYYSAPYDAVSRLWIIPWSLVAVLFPTFSGYNAKSAKQDLELLFTRSVKVLLLSLGPIIIVIIAFARDILRLWLGSGFAERSTVVLQVLAAAVFVVSLANVPYTLLQGLGRPDIPAKFLILELPAFAVTLWLLIPTTGIVGAALASFLRITLDAALLFASCRRLFSLSSDVLFSDGIRRTMALLLLSAAAVVGLKAAFGGTILIDIGLAVGLTVLFVPATWHYALDAAEKASISALFGSFARIPKGSI